MASSSSSALVGWALLALVCRAAGAQLQEPATIVDGLVATWNACADDANATLACQGVRMVRSAVNEWLGDGDVTLPGGLHLVRVEQRASRKLATDGGVVGRLQRFLQSHELRLPLSTLLPSGDDWFNNAIQRISGDYAVTGRKKDKGGGMLLALGGMMMSGLGAMGLMATAAMAMKALGVAMMAMMLAAIAGIKKLAGGGDDGGHHVSVVPLHHGGGDYHRRRRDASPLPQEWLPYSAYYKQLQQ